MNIAFFDFDGTITKSDSFLHFLWYSNNKFIFVAKTILLLPILFALYFRWVKNNAAKEIVFSFFYKKRKKRDLDLLAKQFSKEVIPNLLHPKAVELLHQHRQNNDKIVVVSASIDTWLEVWCQTQGFELICTQAEVKDGVLTGKFASENCNGREKVIQIQKKIILANYDTIFAYGNSRGDYKMLALAHEAFLFDKTTQCFQKRQFP